MKFHHILIKNRKQMPNLKLHNLDIKLMPRVQIHAYVNGPGAMNWIFDIIIT